MVYESDNNTPVTGIFITIGFLLMENIGDSYVYMKKQSRARKLLIIIWMVLAWFLSVSYMSVLLSKLVSLEYEKPIETVEDMLSCKHPIYVHPSVAFALKKDMRERVQQLAKKVTPEKWDGGRQSNETLQRQARRIFSKLSVLNSHFDRFFANEMLQILTPEAQDLLGDKVRIGKELIESLGYSHTLPRASPLKVRQKQ